MRFVRTALAMSAGCGGRPIGGQRVSFVMRQPLLMIPGPTESPEEVLRRCGLPAFPHYEGDFPAFYDQLVRKMKDVFVLTNGQVHIANGSGATAVNMMLASLCTPDESVLIVNNGSFGAWTEMNLRSLGVPYVSVMADHGTAVNTDEVRDEMKRGRHRFIYVTHNESSTAMVNPLPPLGEVAREFDALLLADSVSAVGGMVIDMDGAGADVVAGASQKCLELPPGLAPVAVGDRAWDTMRSMSERRVPHVLDLLAWQTTFETKHDWHPQPMTGATTLLYALDWMADRIIAEGIERRQERFRAAGERLKAGFCELGFGLAADPRYASPVVTEFLMPSGLAAAEFRTYTMREHNTMVGQGGRTNADGVTTSFRVAHFGRSAEGDRIDSMIDIAQRFMGFRKRAGSIANAAPLR